MTFSIRAFATDNIIRGECEILIGDNKECVPLITTLWSIDDYKSQWAEALGALAEGNVNCCALITDIQPKDVSVGISYWAVFRENSVVYLQERFARDQPLLLIGTAKNVESYIPSRIYGTPEDHAHVSEWKILMSDVCHFLKN